MGWHETESQPERAEHLRRVVAHYLVGVVVAYKMNVAIYGIDGFIGAEGMRHVLQHIIGSEIVVGIEYSHHISRAAADSLVHGVVDAAVFLRDIVHPATEHGFVFLYYVNGSVGGTSIYDPIVYVGIRLREYRLEGRLQSGSTIICGCYQGYLHKLLFFGE